jgi:anthranilate synthase component 1
MSLTDPPSPLTDSTMTKNEFLEAVAKTKEHIVAGDVFQLVLSHRFARTTYADPFDVYRALRVVNPSPYMIYLQSRGSIVVASSPEILCRTDKDRVVVNRPLAGTRMRVSIVFPKSRHTVCPFKTDAFLYNHRARPRRRTSH